MKKAEPCAEFKSRDPGEGAHYPDPCQACGWSRPDHDSYWLVRDTKNAVLIAVNDALDGTGIGIARGTIDGEDFYQVVHLVKVEKRGPVT